MSRKVLYLLLNLSLLLPAAMLAQSSSTLPGIGADPLGRGPTLSPLTMPTLSPGEIELVKLEGEFSDSVVAGGGKAFASWFAEDGVTLQNGKPPVRGRAAIAASAVWDPKDYQLTWYAEGAQMAPGGKSGFTWGHYTATAKDRNGQPLVLSGRNITVWKKVAGQWKVALEASADDVPNAGDCCALPKP
jgi:ketosteroid isomerase-like protein